MKLAKKILSVVLAVAIALGAFAVAASANGNPDTAEYQSKFWLTGSTGSVTWTSNNAVTIKDNGNESEPGATIEVQPGDTVFVRMYVTNNYYVGLIQANLFFSSRLLDAAEVYQSQRNRKITAANLKKIHLWNMDHYWVSVQGTAYSGQNAWSFQDATANANVADNWPTDDAGNSLFKVEDWKWNRILNLASDQTGETCIFDDADNHLIMMPVTVPEDAQPGETFKVTIPEGSEQRSAKRGGPLRLTEIGIADGEDAPCDYVDTQAQTNHNMTYADENQYFDLSEATLTLVVPGAAADADTAALEAKLAEANARLSDDLTDASVTLLNAAIEAGEAALTSNDQDQIDAAVATLTEALAASEVKADYSALNAAISRYEDLDAAAWDDASFANATAKYNDAKAIAAGLGVSKQGTIDAAAAALNTAIDNLAAALDYSALTAKIAEVEDTDTSIYTDETAGRFNAALAAAKALVATTQAEIDAALAELTAAYAALDEKAADYSALIAAKEAFEALDAKAWTSASYNDAKAAYDVADAVAEGLKISDQAIIDKAAADLDAAIKALVPATGADYNALDKAIADAKALVADHYVSFADVTAALAVAEGIARDLTSEDQATIDAATKALNDAIGALVPADADYSAVIAAKAAAAAKVAENDEGTLRYTDASIEAINNAVAAVVEGLKKADQATVDGYAAAINAAIAAVEYRDFDNSDVLAKIEEFKSYDRDDYVYSTYDDVAAAIDTYVADYTHEFYAQAKLQDIKFNRVWTALTLAPAADYSAVDAAEAKAEALDENAYTPESWADLDAALAAVVRGYNANKQAEVDAMAQAIEDAILALDEIVIEYADYTALNNALADAANYAADAYTSATYAVLADAVADGNAVDKNLLKADQAIVDAAAQAIVDAIAALKAKADYSALDAAILRAGTYDKNAWTTDSWAAVEAALADANDVDRDLSVDEQATVTAAADALNTALDKLVAKEVVSSISTITYKPSEDTHNTFDVVVNGRVAMVQFIEEDGGTRTYDRYNKNVTIVSYNAAGEEVNELDRELAYEVWTINTNLIGPDVNVRTKYISGTRYVWETETYNFTVETLEPVIDADVREITPAATSGKKGAIATTVVVGPDAQGVKFVMEDGSTTTYSADKATVLENGDLEFTGKAWANNEGLNTIVVKVKVNGAWVEAGTFDYTVE